MTCANTSARLGYGAGRGGLDSTKVLKEDGENSPVSWSHDALSTDLCVEQVMIQTTARGGTHCFTGRTGSESRAHACMKLLIYNYSTSFQMVPMAKPYFGTTARLPSMKNVDIFYPSKEMFVRGLTLGSLSSNGCLHNPCDRDSIIYIICCRTNSFKDPI